jgi:UDP-N-acetylglucosamine--N-acetylmuramyl-(pentapeptide) pyrophosphoryl-undecaprenol N-acetylglucosamine transferase
MTRPRHYVFAGGGSGGHLTPLIAVAEKLLSEDPSAHVTFLTSGRTIDAKVIQHSPVAGNKCCTVLPLPITRPPNVRPSGWKHLIPLWKSIRQCRRLFSRLHVDVVVGSGAFASVPGLLAARALGIPTVVFEANVEPGRVNRWWAPRAVLRLAGFPGGLGDGLSSFEQAGMPLGDTPLVTAPFKKQILIIGGSQGSHRLNRIVAKALSETSLPDGWTGLHQTGASTEIIRKSECPASHITATDFIPDVMKQMAQSAFIISRAGAVTLAELAATGCPAILIPLSNAADNHQQSNAQSMADKGAAVVIDETRPEAAADLSRAIACLITDQSARDSMSESMRRMHRPGAALDIARRLKNIADIRVSPSVSCT